MKIVYVTMEYINPDNLNVIDGGLANYLHKITTCLYKMGHDITVIVADSYPNKHIDYNGIDVIYINNKFQKKLIQKILWPFITKKKRKLLKRNFLHYAISNAINKINKKNKIDVIQYASCRGLGRYPQKDIPSCVRISSYAKLMQKFYSYHDDCEIEAETLQIKNNKFIFGPSSHIANYIKDDLGVNKDIKIIESPYSECKISADNTILNELQSKIKSAPFLLFFGTIGELKGCKVIADCIYDILNQYPNLHMVLVGKNATFINDIDYAQIINKKAKEHANRVIRFPSLPHSQLYPLISNCLAVVMPSLTENFSNACVEAMRLKKIVIGTEGNFSQLITDGQNGFLAKVGDSESLKAKIVEVMSLNADKRQEIEEKSFQRTESLSPENICNQLLDYYKFIIKNWENKNE
ncbi:MAG: glycosyltransferase family 4 protein [Alphaproteobacteria bacterium]|nr:glycosyltransferase family 4 protein [Alphaproteobacteria bacterium]